MAATLRAVMRLLLLSFIPTGVSGEDGLILVGQSYDVTFPCEEDLVCFHLWQLPTGETSDYIAIVTNGEIQIANSIEDEDSKCTLRIKDLTAEDVGHHRCQQRPDVPSPYNPPSASPVLNLMPGKTVSLQCALLTYVQQGHCYSQTEYVSLTWVDESGAEVQEDSRHRVKQESHCDTTLTVTLQGPNDKKFRCQAAVGEQVYTSVEVRVRVPGFKGRGRGIIIDLEPENKGGNQDWVGAAVGAVGCVVLATLVAVFVMNKRRARNQLSEESFYTTSTNDVASADNMIYAEIVLPVGSDRVLVSECESTEYACVRYR